MILSRLLVISAVTTALQNLTSKIDSPPPQAMWRVMHTYHQIKLTHERRDERGATGEEKEEADEKFSRNYVRTKLENGLLRVWRVSY